MRRRIRGVATGHLGLDVLLFGPFIIIPAILLGHEMTNGLNVPEIVIGIVLLLWLVKWLRRPPAEQSVPLPPEPRPDAQPVWEGARDRFRTLSGEYAAFECDPVAVLRRPALADVRVPSTARFVDAYAEALALATDEPPPDSHRMAFVVAVDVADRAWRAARTTADRIQDALLEPGERATVHKVIKLLTTATHSENESERLAAYSRARSELNKLSAAGVVRLPAPAQASLEQAARGSLPPGADRR